MDEKNVNSTEEAKTEKVTNTTKQTKTESGKTTKKSTNKVASKDSKAKTTAAKKTSSSKETNQSSEASKKDDLTFKRVEMNSKNKKTLDDLNATKKKSHGFAKAILIIIMILIAAYCIFFVRNLIILHNIADKIADLENVENYSFNTKSTNSDSSIVTIQYYKKDNLERFDLTKDDTTLIYWYDSDTREKILASPTDRRATVSSDADDSAFVSLPVCTELYNDETIAYMSLISMIYSENYNGIDCYVISLGNDQKTWVEKETGYVVKRETVGTVAEYNNVRVNELTEVYKPDLTGYEITNE